MQETRDRVHERVPGINHIEGHEPAQDYPGDQDVDVDADDVVDEPGDRHRRSRRRFPAGRATLAAAPSRCKGPQASLTAGGTADHSPPPRKAGGNRYLAALAWGCSSDGRA